MKNIIFFLFALCTLLSCASKESNAGYSKSSIAEKQVPPSEAKISNAPAISISRAKDQALPELQNRKLIKTANYRMKVENVDASTVRIQDLAQEMNGIISNMSLTSNTHQVQNSMTVLVPNENFENLLRQISKEALFINQKQINTNDMTEEFIDIASRLATKKQVRDRYTEILRSKASTIQEVFAAEEKIRVLQEEIEAKEGRLKYLSEKVNNSQINLVLYETVLEQEEPLTYQASIGKQFKTNLTNGWNIILNIFLMLVNIWPLLLAALGVFLFRKRLFR